jgi:hypothetical protein
MTYNDWNNTDSDSWHAVRETSREIACAIHEVAERNGITAERVWDSPLDTEEEEVLARAFELAGKGVGDTLFWGGQEVGP